MSVSSRLGENSDHFGISDEIPDKKTPYYGDMPLHDALHQDPAVGRIMIGLLEKVAGAIPIFEANFEVAVQSGGSQEARNAQRLTHLLKKVGDWFYEHGHVQHALQAYLGVLKFDSDDDRIQTAVGDIYFGLKNCAQAKKYYQEALKNLPKDEAAVRKKLSAVFTRMGKDSVYDPDSAHQYYVEALKNCGQNGDAFLGLADVLLEKDELEFAEAAYLQGYKTDPARALVGIAKVCFARNEESEGAIYLHKAIDCDKKYFPAHLEMAKLQFYVRNNLDFAKTSVDRAIALKPKDQEALMLKVEIAMAMKDFELAEGMVKTVLKIDGCDQEAFEAYVRLMNVGAMKIVDGERQLRSRDFLYSLQNYHDPNDGPHHEKYWIMVAKANGQKYSRFPLPEQNWGEQN